MAGQGETKGGGEAAREQERGGGWVRGLKRRGRRQNAGKKKHRSDAHHKLLLVNFAEETLTFRASCWHLSQASIVYISLILYLSLSLVTPPSSALPPPFSSPKITRPLACKQNLHQLHRTAYYLSKTRESLFSTPGQKTKTNPCLKSPGLRCIA